MGKFENLGVPLNEIINQDSTIGKDDLGRDVIYSVIKGGNDSTVFAIVDLRTSIVLQTIPMPGVTGAWAVAAASDGTIYMATHYNGHLYRYIPGSEHLIDLGKLGQETVIWSIAAGLDGKVYAGTYPNAHVFEYDPITDRINDLGRVHPNERYVRSLAFDPDRKVLYAGIGGITAGIIKIVLADNTKEEILANLLPPAYTNYQFVFRMGYALGKLFVKLNKPDHLMIIDVERNAVEYYDPKGLSFGSLDVAAKPGDDRHIFFGGRELYSYDIVNRTFTKEGPNITFHDARFLLLDDPDWPGMTFAASGERGRVLLYNLSTQKTSLTRFENAGAPTLIQSLNCGFDGNIYIGGYMTGFASYKPESGEFSDNREFGQVESVASLADKLYIGTYGNARIHEYNPAEPWGSEASANPRMLVDLYDHGQDRPFSMLGVSSLNKLFMGSVADYHSHSGALAVYDTHTGEAQVFKNIVHNQGVVSLAYSNGYIFGGTSIYGGLGTSGPIEQEGKLFVFDTATNKKVFEIAPASGRKVVSGLLAGPDGLIWGVAEDYIFKFDPNAGQVVYKEVRLSRYGARTVWVDAFLRLGTDGNVYGTNISQKFFRIEPETMEFVLIKDHAGKYLTQDFNGHFYMSMDSDLWKYTIQQ